MKTLHVISTHSFVDLITNSSTELYVCDAKKTLGAVESLLRKLLETHNEMMETSYTFEQVFAPLTTANYNFSYWDVPQEVATEYEYYKEYGNPFCSSRHSFSYNRPVNEEKSNLLVKEQAIRAKYPYIKNKSEQEEQLRHKAQRAEEDALWTDWGARALQSEYNLFIEFLKQNKFTASQIRIVRLEMEKEVAEHRRIKNGAEAWIKGNFKGKKLNDARETFSTWESYGIHAKKGAVLVYSAGDNTIPYELMDALTDYLGAERFHLG